MGKSALNKNGISLTILWGVTVAWILFYLSIGWFNCYDNTGYTIGYELEQLTFVVIPLIFVFSAGRFTDSSGKIAAIILAVMHMLYAFSYIIASKLGINIFSFLGNLTNIVMGIIDYGLFIWMILALKTTTAVKVTGIITQIPLFLASILFTVWQFLNTGYNLIDYELSNLLSLFAKVFDYIYLITVIIALIFAIVSINKRQVMKIPNRTFH